MEYIKVKSIDDGLDKCRQLVIENIRETNYPAPWDGEVKDISPEQQYNNIVRWCKTNIKNITWSHNDSARLTFKTSYGAKHRCEQALKCYVANNWMKMAMIDAGLEVNSTKNVSYETGRVGMFGVRLDQILTNSENFICRVKNNNEHPQILDYTRPIKYCCGNYDE